MTEEFPLEDDTEPADTGGEDEGGLDGNAEDGGGGFAVAVEATFEFTTPADVYSASDPEPSFGAVGVVVSTFAATAEL